jgi:hypothetical protein
MMSESDLAEAAHLAADVLGADLSDPGCFDSAQSTVEEMAGRPDDAFALFGPCWDAHTLRHTLTAVAQAAAERGVPPSQLWNALDALERS